MYIPCNSFINPLQALAEYTFLLIIYFSNTEIYNVLYSFYRKNLNATLKIQEKSDGSPYSFLKINHLPCKLSRIKKVVILFMCVCVLIKQKILSRRDVQYKAMTLTRIELWLVRIVHCSGNGNNTPPPPPPQ